jgi:hypothetical protein
MREILDETRQFVQAKQASFKQAIAGDDPNSMPGSDHDKPVEDSMKQPDPEVKQELPPGGTSSEGAKPASEVEQGHTLDALQPVKSVKKEPLHSDDAMAGTNANNRGDNWGVKNSSDLANDILSDIRNLKKAEEEQGSEKKAETEEAAPEGDAKEAAPEGDAKEAAPEGEAKEAMPGMDYDGDKKKSKKKKSKKKKSKKMDYDMDYGKKAEEGKQAAEIELTQDVLSKIAAVVLSTEEGWDFVENAMAKEAGAEAARETMDFLTKQAEDLEKQSAYDQGVADAEALIHQAAYDSGYADADNLLKQSAQQGQAADFAALGRNLALEALGHKKKLSKSAQMEELAGLGDMDDTEVGGAEEALGGMVEPPQDEEISPEELEQALAMLVQEGSIAPEEAQAIVEYVDQVAGGGGAEELAADAAPVPMAEGYDDNAEEETGIETAASANEELLQAIRRAQASKE